MVATSPADGYTLLLTGSFNAINATLHENLKFDFVRDVAPVAGIMRNPLVMVVNPSVPVNTVAEFIGYAKANPGKINVGTGGIGSPQHMASELFKMMTNLNIVPVHYRGSAPMLTDLLRGELHVSFDPMLSAIEHVRSGKLRALAVTTASRSPALSGLQLWANLCRALKRADGPVLQFPRTLQPTSCRHSIERSMRPLPTPASGHVLQT